MIFIQENVFENVVGDMAAILFETQCVKSNDLLTWKSLANRWKVLMA